MTTSTDEPLSGQQLQAISAKASAALQQAVDRIELRRQCIEYAIRANTSPNELIKIAAAMLTFILAEAHQVRVSIDPPSL